MRRNSPAPAPRSWLRMLTAPPQPGSRQAIVADGYEAIGLATDVSDPDSTRAMADAAVERFGGIDVLINNASLMSVLPRRSWLEIPDRRVGPGDGGEPARPVPVLPGGVPGHARAWPRQDRQHLVEPGLGGQPQPPALHHFEGRRDRLYPRARPRGGRVRHHRERGDAGTDAERHAGRSFLRQLPRASRPPDAPSRARRYPKISSARSCSCLVPQATS